MKYLLQQYEDGTVGYFLVDGDEYENYTTGSKTKVTQGSREKRYDFLAKNNIVIGPGEYGSNEELDKLFNEGDISDKEYVASTGYAWKKFINDSDGRIREAVAKSGNGLDILVHDKESSIRELIAKQGYGLDILVHDPDWRVRLEVAKQGYGFDILLHDENLNVKIVLVNMSYKLEVLIFDENKYVKQAVLEKLLENKYTDIINFCKDIYENYNDKLATSITIPNDVYNVDIYNNSYKNLIGFFLDEFYPMDNNSITIIILTLLLKNKYKIPEILQKYSNLSKMIES